MIFVCVILLIASRGSTSGYISCDMYYLNGFTLDGPQTQLSTGVFLSLMWLCKLEQLTVTHSMLPEAGMQAAAGCVV